MALISLENLALFQKLNKNYIDERISKYENFEAFPKQGMTNTLYIDKSTGNIYYWDNGYVDLNSSIVLKDTYLQFPSVGNENMIYIDTTENAIYRFSESELKYYLIASDWNNIKLINATF